MIALPGRSAAAWVVPAIVVALSLLLPAAVSAQAWLPFKGEGTVSAAAQRIRLSGHFDTDGSRLPECAPSDAYVVVGEFEYGITNKLALNAKLPYIASRYTGAADEPCTAELRTLHDEFQHQSPHQHLTSLDTGSYYATFQDFGLTLRYTLLDRGVVVTPLISATIPSHHYRTVGEAAPGQDRLALQTGVFVGRLLDPILPGAYVQAGYGYSFVQRLRGLSLNRSNAEFEAGYSVTPTVVVRGLVAWQKTHGGLTYYEAIDKAFGVNGEPGIPEIFLDHDRLMRNRYWHVGGGATVNLTDSVDFNAAVLTFPAGADSHYGLGATFGVSWRVLSPKLPSRSNGTR